MTASLLFDQTGPHPLVLRTRRSRLCRPGPAAATEQTLHHLLRAAHPRIFGEHRRDGGHSLPVGLLSFGKPHRRLRWAGLDHGNALAVDGGYQDRAGRRFRSALPIKRVKVSRSIQEHLLQASLRNAYTGDCGQAIDGFLEGALHRRLH
jgi:hypothetical protein